VPPAPVADADINAPEAWSITTGTPSVRVGILDSGINDAHLDFEGRVNLEDGWSMVPVPPITLPPYCGGFLTGDPPRDDNGHGTAVAGIVAASGNNNNIGVAGVAWGVTPIAIKLFDCFGLSNSSRFCPDVG
jgi:subtilisin family serine protease